MSDVVKVTVTHVSRPLRSFDLFLHEMKKIIRSLLDDGGEPFTIFVVEQEKQRLPHEPDDIVDVVVAAPATLSQESQIDAGFGDARLKLADLSGRYKLRVDFTVNTIHSRNAQLP